MSSTLSARRRAVDPELPKDPQLGPPDGTLRGVFDVRAEHIMTPLRDLHPVRHDTPLRDVAHLLAEERIDSLPSSATTADRSPGCAAVTSSSSC